MDTYETVNEESQEHTYAVVEKSNRKSRRRQRDSSTEEQGIAMQMLSDEGYLIPTEHPVTTIAAEEQEDCEDEFKKKEKTKDCVYAVVHIKPGQGKDSVSKGSAVQGEGLEATSTPCLFSKDGNSVKLPDVSSFGHGKEMTNNEAAAGQNPDSGEENKDYLYAVVNKTNKKQTPPQVTFILVSVLFLVMLYPQTKRCDTTQQICAGSTLYRVEFFGGVFSSQLSQFQFALLLFCFKVDK